MRKQSNLERFESLCLALPNTKKTMTWGSPHYRVGEKIFAGASVGEDGKESGGFKLTKEHQAERVASDPRFTIAAYVGKHGWVDMDLRGKPDWDEVKALVEESYRLIAPKRLVKLLDEGAGSAKPRAVTKAAVKRTANRRASR